jgi:CSLREA domain-containing protein
LSDAKKSFTPLRFSMMRIPMTPKIVLLLTSFSLCTTIQAATFVVDTTSDASLSACDNNVANDCSLRGAITVANATPAADLIHFNIPMTDSGFQSATSHWRISIADMLPLLNLTSAITIDGNTQPGAIANSNTPVQGGLNGQLKIEVRGANPAGNVNYAFQLLGSEANALIGLAISGFSSGQVFFGGSSTHRVQGCYIGTDITGNLAANLNGTQPSTNGLVFGGNGNYIVGGTQASERNLISGLNIAISTNGSFLANATIQGNLVGTNAAGIGVIGNTFGLLSFRFGNTLIGGTDPSARNVFSGHTGSAMAFRAAGNSGIFANTRLLGNYFGTDVTGTRRLGNDFQRSGSTIEFSALGCGLTFGGTQPGEANLIAYSSSAGVAVRDCNGLQTPLNRYFANLGIAFDNSQGNLLGASVNDANDIDESSNRLQNYPELTLPAAGSSLLSYRVDTATANASYPITVNLYRGACGGGSDAYLGSATVTAAQAQQTLSIDVTALGSYLPITATAVDATGNTSEFAPTLGEVIFLGSFEDNPGAVTVGSCR